MYPRAVTFRLWMRGLLPDYAPTWGEMMAGGLLTAEG